MGVIPNDDDKAQAVILVFASDMAQCVTSSSHSLLSLSPHDRGSSCLMTTMENLFSALPNSFTDQVLSAAWYPYLFISVPRGE